MRRIHIKNVCKLVVSVAVMLPVSCKEDAGIGMEDACQTGPHKVGFYAGGSQTRTEMLENGLSAAWVADDQLAMWAKNSSGSYILSNQIFKTFGIDDELGYFTSELASAMPEDTYTYYCCYPIPSSVSGTKVTIDVPSIQDGKVSGGADVMIATPVQHGALAPKPEIEDHSGLSMQMNRMLHQFRFFISDGGEKLQGASVEKIKLEFPMPVVGSTVFDYADPTIAPVLNSGYRDITLNLSQPISQAQQNYACVSFVPSAFKSGEYLNVKAYTSDKIVKVNPIDLCAREFLAGHSTPVRFIVEEVIDYPYVMTFRVSANNLGENVNTLIFTAPQGCRWPDADSNVYTYTPGHEITTGEEIVFRFDDEAKYRAFSGKQISVTYDSENTITYQTLTLPDMTGTDKVNASLSVPYLFFEDFSGIPSFSDGHDNPGVGLASDTWVGITDLSTYAPSLDGWYAARAGGQAGTSLRICCRYEDVLDVGAYYKGRLYTPQLSGIKDGKLVKISVSYRYGGNRNEMKTLINWNYTAPDKSPVLYFGINYQDTITNPDQMEGDIIDSVTGLVTGTGFRQSKPSSLSPLAIDGEYLPKTGGSYTSFAGTRNVTIDKIDNGMRLGWILTTDNTQASVNANYWLYIDDIKVQIAK